MTNEAAKVLVVGAGIVGLSAALFLAAHDIQCVQVERHADSSPHPRAVGFVTRKMELYRDGGWLLMFPDEQDHDGPALVTLIEKAIGQTDLPVEIITTDRWELSALIAARFSCGRVFLVGDAARTLPPACGGYGANTGIEDAQNLAWKIACVGSGVSNPDLLDTYDTERQPIVWLRHGQIFARPDYRRFATESDVEVPVIEDVAMELGQLYRSSAVMDASDELPPALRPDQWNGQPGTRADHVWVAVRGARISTLGLVQSDWVMLTEDTCWLAAAQAVAQSLELKLECVLIGGAVANPTPSATSNALDLPIEWIAADPQHSSTLISILPEVMDHPDYQRFKCISLRQLQPLSSDRISSDALARAELAFAGIAGPSVADVESNAFTRTFGIGPSGASSTRPDGYIAWRAVTLPKDPVAAITTALGRVAHARLWQDLAPQAPGAQ